MGFPGKYGNYGVWEFLGYFYFLGRDLTLKCVGNPGENTAGEISGASEGKNENFPLMKHVVLECCQIL